MHVITATFVDDEPGITHHPQMLGYSPLGYSEPCSQRVDAQWLFPKELDYADPRAHRENLRRPRQIVCIVIHNSKC